MAIVVDEQIINSPFAEPARHYRMRGGRPELAEARRPSGFTPGLRARDGQGTLFEEEYVELPLVNAIRERARMARGRLLRIVQRYVETRVTTVGATRWIAAVNDWAAWASGGARRCGPRSG